MKILQEIQDDEMIAAFLQAEINSDRWGSTLRRVLKNSKVDRKILDKPNLSDKKENEIRRKILAAFRGYGENMYLFQNFPTDVIWKRTILTKNEVEKILYVNWEYWNEVTHGTRLPAHLAKRIQMGEISDGEELQRFKSVVRALRSGIKFPTIILVAKDEDARLVVLEGHLRISAYALEPDFIPDTLEVIIGFSKNIEKWTNY